MRVIVCGGRDYYDQPKVHVVLNGVHFVTSQGISEIITGGALGADTWAYGWCLRNEVTCIVVPYKGSLGKAGGVIRNKEIVTKWGGDLCIAFPGGKGTANMVKLCRAANIPVQEILK